MPWCPNCKTEYREGITHCADCKAELVADLSVVKAGMEDTTSLLVKVDGRQADFAKKLADFLEYSGVPVNVSEPDAEGLIGVYTTPEAYRDAKRHFQAFYSVEAENAFLSGEETLEQEFFSEEEEADVEEKTEELPAEKDIFRHEKSYVSAVSRYEDYRSSGFTFVSFGILGTGFALLNLLDIVPLFNVFSAAVILVMFTAFLVMGIFSFTKAGKLKEDAVKEKALTAEVRKWLEENISEDTLHTYDTRNGTEGKSEELLYLNRLDSLRETLLTEFPDLNSSFAEQLIEDFYSTHFD